jgi:hypothetical protein
MSDSAADYKFEGGFPVHPSCIPLHALHADVSSYYAVLSGWGAFDKNSIKGELKKFTYEPKKCVLAKSTFQRVVRG